MKKSMAYYTSGQIGFSNAIEAGMMPILQKTKDDFRKCR